MNQLFVFAQNDAINRFVDSPRNIDFKDCVKSITIYNYSFKKNKETVDTIKTINKMQFNKKGIITQQWNFNKSIKDPWQIIEYDNKGRTLTVSRKNKDKISLFAKQFFNNFSEYSDSLNIYRGEKSKTDQYINHFNKKLLVKQEYYTQDTLRHYNTYQYDKKSRLIKESFINTEKGWGITIGKSITGNRDEKTLNSNDYTTYDYNKFKDTTVITKTKFTLKHTYKEVKKELKTNTYSLEVKDEYDNDYLHQSTHTYTSKDSIFNCTYYYKNKREISRFYKTITKLNVQVGRWNSNVGTDQESTQTIKIDTVLDEFDNWTRKVYSTNNITTQLIIRDIEYYYH
jgi:hypothetical protein